MGWPSPPRRRQRGGVATPVTRTRKRIAFSIAALSDLAQWFFFPVLSEGWLSPFEIPVDAGTALPIVLVVGFHRRLAVVLVAELVPGVDMFPPERRSC